MLSSSAFLRLRPCHSIAFSLTDNVLNHFISFSWAADRRHSGQINESKTYPSNRPQLVGGLCLAQCNVRGECCLNGCCNCLIQQISSTVMGWWGCSSQADYDHILVYLLGDVAGIHEWPHVECVHHWELRLVDHGCQIKLKLLEHSAQSHKLMEKWCIVTHKRAADFWNLITSLLEAVKPCSYRTLSSGSSELPC